MANLNQPEKLLHKIDPDQVTFVHYLTTVKGELVDDGHLAAVLETLRQAGYKVVKE
jgi:hypothetical protein